MKTEDKSYQPFWSTIQGINTLYYSRLQRFSEEYRDNYMAIFGLSNAKRILEIGCGPGALAKRLRAWYKDCDIVALDRDLDFLRFAEEQVQGVRFLEGDATALPFEDKSFDVVISYTVQEHIEPDIFFSEQFRILKEAGVCIVISCRPGSGVERKADCLIETPREQRIWSKAEERYLEQSRRNNVGAYWLNEQELPLAMEKSGFKNVSTAYIVTEATPDNPKNSETEAKAMIEEDRLAELDSMENLHRIAEDLISEEVFQFLEAEIERRYDERIRLYDAGQKQWDCKIALNMIVRGEKPD